jgi:hypothetical protein
MTYSLKGITAKIHRADQNIQNLDNEISSFLQQNYRFAPEFDLESRKYSFRAFGEPVLPETFSALIGEILYQFRSCLDHTITQLAEIGPGGGRPDRLEFPICTTPDNFKQACSRGKIEGLSTAARQQIEDLQPYKTHPTDYTLSIIYWINELNRVDKHRLLLVAVACVQMADTFHIDADVTISGMDPPVPPGTRPARDGAEIWSMQFSEVRKPKVDVKGNFAFQVAFDYPGVLENRPVVDMLTQMGQATVLYIKQLCPDFEP